MHGLTDTRFYLRIHLLCDVVSKNGNLLLNIGPRADGTIPDGMQRRLLAMGEWLQVNGEAIYGTRPWARFKQAAPEMHFTAKPDALYAILLHKPDAPFVIETGESLAPHSVTSVTLLGSEAPLQWSPDAAGIRVTPSADWPGEHAWTLKVQHAVE